MALELLYNCKSKFTLYAQYMSIFKFTKIIGQHVVTEPQMSRNWRRHEEQVSGLAEIDNGEHYELSLF